MNKILVFMLSLFISTAFSYAAIGNYNFLIGVGGGYKTSEIYGGLDDLSSSSDFYVDMPSYELNAPVVRVDLGLPLHWAPHKHAFVHALDLRANFTASFARGTVLDTTAGKIEQKINSIGGGIQAVYGIGVVFGDKVSGSRLVFDLLGFGFSMASEKAERTLTYTDSSKSSKTLKEHRVSTAKMEYIVPGIHYFDKSGFTVGLRNSFQMFDYSSPDNVFDYSNLDNSSIDFPLAAFTTYIYVGYAFSTIRSK